MFRHFLAIIVCCMVLLPDGTVSALSKKEKMRTDKINIPAKGISKIRFEDISRSNFVYRGSPDADRFNIVFTRTVKARDSEECDELLDKFDLEVETAGDVVEIRLRHPKYRSEGFFKSILKGKEWKVKLEVTGPRVMDMDLEEVFSEIHIDSTKGEMDVDINFCGAEVSDHTGFLKASTSFSNLQAGKLDGNFAVSTEFGHINLKLARLAGNSSARTSFGAIEIQLPRNTGADFHVNKSFGGIEFDVKGELDIEGRKGVRRILNEGGPRIDLDVEFGGIIVRDNLSEYHSSAGMPFVRDAVMPVKMGAWWRYVSGEDSLTLKVEKAKLVDEKRIVTLTFEGPGSHPFESIDVCETPDGLLIAGIHGMFFGKDLSGLQFDPPRLWLPYSDREDAKAGDKLFGAAKVKRIDEKEKTEAEQKKTDIHYTMQTGEFLFYELTLVPGVGFTAFGSDFKLVAYDLEGVKPAEPVSVKLEEEPPAPPPFEEGEVKSITFRGLGYLPKTKVEKFLGIQKNGFYSRGEIAGAVCNLSGKSKFINSANFTIDSKGNLKVRIHEADLFSWDWDAYGSFSRVAGVGFGPILTLNSLVGPISEITGGAQYHWGNKEWTFTANVEKRFFKKNRLALGGSYYQDYESCMEWTIPKYDSYINAFILGLETNNFYKVEGVTGYISQSIGNLLELKAEYFEEDFSSVKKHTNWSLFNHRHKKEDNPSLSPDSEGRITGLRYSVELKKSFSFSNCALLLSAEKTNDGDDLLPEYTRFLGNAVYTARIPYHHLIKVRVAGGFSEDALPEQKSFRLGGLNTLKGFDFGSVPEPTEDFNGGFTDHSGGNRMFLANLDYFLEDKNDFCLVLFGDVGGVWRKDDVVGMKQLKRNLGVGLVFEGDFFPLEDRRSHEIISALRVNWAVPVGPEPHVSHWTVNFVRAY